LQDSRSGNSVPNWADFKKARSVAETSQQERHCRAECLDSFSVFGLPASEPHTLPLDQRYAPQGSLANYVGSASDSGLQGQAWQ
jgi:hypothetical protein